MDRLQAERIGSGLDTGFRVAGNADAAQCAGRTGKSIAVRKGAGLDGRPTRRTRYRASSASTGTGFFPPSGHHGRRKMSAAYTVYAAVGDE